jgi:hypothetical protein
MEATRNDLKLTKCDDVNAAQKWIWEEIHY